MSDKVKTPKPRYRSRSFQNAGSAPRLAFLLEAQQKAEIGLRIKALRDNSAETSRSIAAYCDVSVEAVRNWIAGRGISWEHGEQVAEMFNVEFDWLWRGREKSETPDLLSSPDRQAEQLDRIEKGITEILGCLKPGEQDEEGFPDAPPLDPESTPTPEAPPGHENNEASSVPPA